MNNAAINSGSLLWKKAKKIIPGGNQLLSKRAEMFLPTLWPSYYKKAKGCEIWDLDGNHYYDFAQMGVGSCILGYADPDVNCQVIQAIENGSMSSLNTSEEVQLAEKLIELHKWSDMVRFSRTGGEACAIAVRIARAASGKSCVAFCGYHGWHDWYLSSNIEDKNNLNQHLLQGLETKGVPEILKGTALPFLYNDVDSLEKVLAEKKGEVGVIFMEPIRNIIPVDDFLKKVRQIATRENAVLVFDEVTTGFRKNIGGIHLMYDVNPDIAVFGKALGNGFPISAIIGKREVMDAAEETFISSTFWTERIGFVAALATIEKIEKYKVTNILEKYGKKINEGWLTLAKKHDINIEISGLEPLTHLEFRHEKKDFLQTLYTQEMLKKGFLVGASVYSTFAYTDEIIEMFIDDSNKAFSTLAKAIKHNCSKEFLKSNVKHAGFERLT